MEGGQGHEPCPQVAQGGQGVSVRVELVTPVLENYLMACSILKRVKRMTHNMSQDY